MEKVTEEMLSEYKDAFYYYDKDNDGAISTEQIGTIMRALGHNPSDTEVNDIICQLDGQDKIDFKLFIMIMSKRRKEGDMEELVEAFKVFDKYGSGVLPATELRHILANIGEKVLSDKVDLMIMKADIKGDGLINYNEFIKGIINNEH